MAADDHTVLVLSEQDVEELLDPAGCLAAVERALVALARGEVHLPLRPMVRPPGDETPDRAHAGPPRRRRPLYGLKTVVVVPDNSARGLDSHQGTVTLFDGETGQTIAVMNASPITAIRTAAASALATRELAREDAHVLAIVGAGHQAKAHLRALQRSVPSTTSGSLPGLAQVPTRWRSCTRPRGRPTRRGRRSRRRRHRHRDELRRAGDRARMDR